MQTNHSPMLAGTIRGSSQGHTRTFKTDFKTIFVWFASSHSEMLILWFVSHHTEVSLPYKDLFPCGNWVYRGYAGNDAVARMVKHHKLTEE